MLSNGERAPNGGSARGGAVATAVRDCGERVPPSSLAIARAAAMVVNLTHPLRTFSACQW